jgi:hypothetical protein
MFELVRKKLSHVVPVPWNAQQRPDGFHACHQALFLHSASQRIENTGVCFWPMPFSQVSNTKTHNCLRLFDPRVKKEYNKQTPLFQ